MRFSTVLLLLPTVVLYLGCQVLAPSITELLAPDEHGLPMDPFDAAIVEVVQGVGKSQLSSSSGHSVGVEADSNHRASGGSHWQQGSPYGADGYLGDANNNYQHVGHRAYQHDRYPQPGSYQGFPPGTFAYVPNNAGYGANGHSRGIAGPPHYTFPNQHGPSHGFGPGSSAGYSNFAGYGVDQSGRQVAGGQRATPRAHAAGGRGKQPVQAYQDRAAYGGQTHPLQSHDPIVVASQSSIRRRPLQYGPKSPDPPLNQVQLKLAKEWIAKELLPKESPLEQLQKSMKSIWNHRVFKYQFGQKESRILGDLLTSDLIKGHVQAWVDLVNSLKKHGDVPSLAHLRDTYQNPFALVAQVIPVGPGHEGYRKSVYSSALAVHASYRIRARIRANVEQAGVRELEGIRRDFTEKALRDYLASWPVIDSHAEAAFLAAPFIKALEEENETRYTLLSEYEVKIFGMFSEPQFSKAGQGST